MRNDLKPSKIHYGIYIISKYRSSLYMIIISQCLFIELQITGYIFNLKKTKMTAFCKSLKKIQTLIHFEVLKSENENISPSDLQENN